jgi:hypothetical protein
MVVVEEGAPGLAIFQTWVIRRANRHPGLEHRETWGTRGGLTPGASTAALLRQCSQRRAEDGVEILAARRLHRALDRLLGQRALIAQIGQRGNYVLFLG